MMRTLLAIGLIVPLSLNASPYYQCSKGTEHLLQAEPCPQGWLEMKIDQTQLVRPTVDSKGVIRDGWHFASGHYQPPVDVEKYRNDKGGPDYGSNDYPSADYILEIRSR